MKQKHAAVAAGLALSLALCIPGGHALADNLNGSSEGPAGQETAASASGASDGSAASGEAEGELPEPADYDKADFYQDAPSAAISRSMRLFASPASRATLVSVSDEMKYFTLYESGRDYDRGFGAGDGYNALGYYQFDRRYGLIEFMRMCVSHNAEKYGVFNDVIAQSASVSSSSVPMYDKSTKKLTVLGRQVEDAWHAAYKADPAEFSALQDTYAYNSYYRPAEVYLAGKGIDMSDRADCVKGLVWGATNLFGAGGVRYFLDNAGLTDDMTDEEFVTALCDCIVNNVAKKYPSQPQYHKGWQDRYKREKADCLEMLAAAADEPADEPGDDPADESGDKPADEPADEPGDEPADDPSDKPADDPADQPGDEPSQDGSTGGTSGPAADEGTDVPSGDTSKPGAPEPEQGPSNGIVADEGVNDGASGGSGDTGSSDTGSEPGFEADGESADGSDSAPEGDGGKEDGDTAAEGPDDGSSTDGRSGSTADQDGSGDSAENAPRSERSGAKNLPETGDVAAATAGIVAVAGAAFAGLGAALLGRGKSARDDR